jgi:hypothetical protein
MSKLRQHFEKQVRDDYGKQDKEAEKSAKAAAAGEGPLGAAGVFIKKNERKSVEDETNDRLNKHVEHIWPGYKKPEKKDLPEYGGD